jgi:hypothetical protein
MSQMTEQEFWAALAPGPDPKPLSFRLYYDEQGLPLFYSMQDEPGNYIEIDRETYHNPPTHIKIVDGKIKQLSVNFVAKLVPSNTGTPCAVDNVCVVVDQGTPHTKWNLKKHEPS